MTPEQEDAALESAWRKLQAAGEKRRNAQLKQAGLEIPYAPASDTVLVLREPAPPVQKMTKGGLHIPGTSQEEPEPKSEGMLVAAGCKALDALRDQGMIVGDRVQIGRFAGWEKEFDLDQAGENKRKILQMAAGDILGSFDLKDRLWGARPTMQVSYDAETGEHRTHPII